MKNQYIGGGNCLTRGEWTVSRFMGGEGGAWQKIGVVFLSGWGGGGDTPMHTVYPQIYHTTPCPAVLTCKGSLIKTKEG